MSLAENTDRNKVIETHRVHPTDTGSPEVQIALLTKRLEILSEHFKKHHADKHSQRGMMAMISRRKRLLQYLRREDVNRYRSILNTLGLRK